MLARCNLAKKKEKHSLAPLDSAAEEADFHPRTWPSVRGHAWDFQRALLFRHGARFAKVRRYGVRFRKRIFSCKIWLPNKIWLRYSREPASQPASRERAVYSLPDRAAQAAYVDTDFLAVGRDPDGIFDLVAPGAFGFWAGSHRRCFHDRG